MKITNSKQFERLVGILQDKPHLARGFSRGVDKIDAKNEWGKINDALNALGPPVRDPDGWLKVWNDLKFKVKTKIIHNKKLQKSARTEGGHQRLLSDLDKAVADLLYLNDDINLSKRKRRRAFQSDSEEEEVLDEQEMPSNSLHWSHTSEQDSLLNAETGEQPWTFQVKETFSDDVCTSLRNVEQYLKEGVRLKMRQLEVQEDWIRFKKTRCLEKEKYRQKKIELKLKKLEIYKLKKIRKISKTSNTKQL